MYVPKLNTVLLSLALFPMLAMAHGGGADGIATSDHRLPITGRVANDDEKPLAGAHIIIDREGQVLGEMTADNKGRFSFELDLGGLYGISVMHEGFLKKRFIVDSRTDKPEGIVTGPFHADVTLTRKELLEGADMEALDMPYALITYSPDAKAFLADAAYILEMQRMEAAMMLGAARARKRAAEKK
jgi:hypothetical protein